MCKRLCPGYLEMPFADVGVQLSSGCDVITGLFHNDHGTLTFYICSVGFTSPMLFDERKYPYHLMLQKFLSCGGLDAFFNTFRWALTCGNKVPIEEGLEHPELPDGTGEFLDAWLMLLEKMVNPKTVLESPHTLPVKPNQQGSAGFNPLLFLIHIHKVMIKPLSKN
ncbi:E3 ubiquitin-protein ligase HUWE1 [Araneus ventricosus]|uniref:E3 ubiquitin-protein ligase HUWE1 n=1 Tax=Araneus ventricosus TaxID=182803 RepID=A0A4Y2FLN6_ARAVE|nr:E3 ubiquitin-protein ligase HUWE1 [Araneus ventricosus]